jgi:hypothetical protein
MNGNGVRLNGRLLTLGLIITVCSSCTFLMRDDFPDASSDREITRIWISSRAKSRSQEDRSEESRFSARKDDRTFSVSIHTFTTLHLVVPSFVRSRRQPTKYTCALELFLINISFCVEATAAWRQQRLGSCIYWYFYISSSTPLPTSSALNGSVPSGPNGLMMMTASQDDAT